MQAREVFMAILLIVSIAVLLYITITTISLWYHAGIILKFIGANLFLFISTKLMSDYNDQLKSE